MKTVGLLLAAGHSRRFGETNKLLAPFQGRPLVAHAAQAMRQAGLDSLVATVGDDKVAALLDGFALSRPSPDGLDQSGSLRAGILACSGLGLDRVLVVLGDMPLVTRDHLRAVVDRCTPTSSSASTDGHRRLPPACFPVSMMDELLAVTGDRGAGALLRKLPADALVHAPPAMLKDVDTTGDLG